MPLVSVYLNQAICGLLFVTAGRQTLSPDCPTVSHNCPLHFLEATLTSTLCSLGIPIWQAWDLCTVCRPVIRSQGFES